MGRTNKKGRTICGDIGLGQPQYPALPDCAQSARFSVYVVSSPRRITHYLRTFRARDCHVRYIYVANACRKRSHPPLFSAGDETETSRNAGVGPFPAFKMSFLENSNTKDATSTLRPSCVLYGQRAHYGMNNLRGAEECIDVSDENDST